MSTCLNILNDPQYFLLAATLIALVLLVWAQLGAPRDKTDLDRDMNLWFGIIWTYVAILSALVAVALFVCEISACAKGFLTLSFLMTIANLFINLGLHIIKIVLEKSAGESLTGVSKEDPWHKKLPWILFYLFLFIGLLLISFSLVGVWSHCCLYVGKALVAAAVVKAIVLLCVRRHDEKKEPGKKDEMCLLFYYSCSKKKGKGAVGKGKTKEKK